MPDRQQSQDKGEWQRINPSMAQFVQLDDIAVLLRKTLKVITSQEALIREQAIVLGSQQKTLDSINRMLLDQRDEGEYFRQEAVANATTFDIIDFTGILGRPVKSFLITNDDATNNILYGHNITPLSIDASINTADARFKTLKPGEVRKVEYNPKRIRNIYIKSVGGSAAYRLEAAW